MFQRDFPNTIENPFIYLVVACWGSGVTCSATSEDFECKKVRGVLFLLEILTIEALAEERVVSDAWASNNLKSKLCADEHAAYVACNE